MFASKIDTVRPGCARVHLLADGERLTYREVVELWVDDAAFRDRFSRLLKNAPFEAYCWETPPLASSTLDRAFEFVLVDEPALRQRRANSQPFADQFGRCEPGSTVASFSSLGGDAFLVAPVPIGRDSAYGHLASFLRSAPEAQCHALWQTVGAAIQQRVGDPPLWASTAGLGVSWLHVRLDSRPKYYRFAEYRRGLISQP